MTNRYEGMLRELLRCGTVYQILEKLHAHIEQVDQGMLTEVIKDDRFNKLHVEVLKGVLKAKADRQR